MELNERHAEVLRRMVETAHGELVSGTTDDDYTAHHATLRALERRGLVEILTRREGDGWAGAKTVYKFARITDAGRSAVAPQEDAVETPATDPPYTVFRTMNGDYQVRRGRKGPLVKNFGRRRSEAYAYVEQRDPAITAHVDIVDPGKGLVTVNAHGGTILREGPGARYRVENEEGLWIGSARSYREGAALVAEHYGVEIAGVEVEQEWKEYKR